MKLMSQQEWQTLRRRLMAEEQAERSGDLASSRAPIQAAVTERAIRELWARCDALEDALTKRVSK